MWRTLLNTVKTSPPKENLSLVEEQVCSLHSLYTVA